MRHRKRGTRLGTDQSHHDAILKGLAAQLFVHERINTTHTRAKELRPFAEKLITMARSGSLNDRRQILKSIESKEIVHKLIADIAPRYADRPGGYTRILKTGERLGDAAPMALIELV